MWTVIKIQHNSSRLTNLPVLTNVQLHVEWHSDSHATWFSCGNLQFASLSIEFGSSWVGISITSGMLFYLGWLATMEGTVIHNYII
jgi:hypothetical protein